MNGFYSKVKSLLKLFVYTFNWKSEKIMGSSTSITSETEKKNIHDEHKKDWRGYRIFLVIKD